MSILDVLAAKLAPYDCLGCGIEGRLLCGTCQDGLPTVEGRCYRCRKLSPDWLTCETCRRTSQLDSVRVATVYSGSAKALVWKLKLAGARTAARTMARLMPLPAAAAIIVPVPTATSRARQRGYDQAKLLARELARRTRLPYRDCLARLGQAHQHGLARGERLTQLYGAFRVTRPGSIRNKRIILVDDVITTGATLEAAAAILRAAGAAQTSAIVFAQPPLANKIARPL